MWLYVTVKEPVTGIISNKVKIHSSLGYFEDVAVDIVPTRLSEFNVEDGKTYRFRLIGAQGTYAYRFSIDKHKLLLVAADGYFIQPQEVDYIIIHTGERYDLRGFVIRQIQH